MTRTIAALFVEKNGVYSSLPDVELWDKSRDARNYAGTRPVVCHPPCARWGRYATGGSSAKVRLTKGADEGCFAAALASVRQWGGVLEHPKDSAAFAAFGLLHPPRSGGWVPAGDGIGWVACVEQGNFGHRARKATWLYAAHTELPALTWGRSGKRCVLDLGFHTAEERRRFYNPPKGMTKEEREARCLALERYAVATGKELCVPERMHRKERLATPVPFRDLLLSIARTAKVGGYGRYLDTRPLL